MSDARRWRWAAIAVLGLAGCGGFASPDLATGQITGRLTDASATGAYAYLLGSPDTRVPLASDGTFTLSGVPVGRATVVLFDGATRAGTVDAEVKAASRTRLADGAAASLPAARTVFVAARPAGGVDGTNARYGVDGVALAASAAVTGSVAQLYPLPPGMFRVTVQAPGYQPHPVEVDLRSDAQVQLQVEVGLDVDDGDLSHRGCLSNPCAGGLSCGENGRCYACTSDAQCGAGASCHDHACVATDGGGDQRPVCAPCSAASECRPGPGGEAALCLAEADYPHCSFACAGGGCPAGYACTTQGGVTACRPTTAGSCTLLYQVLGSSCFGDQSCPPGLTCDRSDGSHEEYSPGQCTGACTRDADCPQFVGYRCDVDHGRCEK